MTATTITRTTIKPARSLVEIHDTPHGEVTITIPNKSRKSAPVEITTPGDVDIDSGVVKVEVKSTTRKLNHVTTLHLRTKEARSCSCEHGKRWRRGQEPCVHYRAALAALVTKERVAREMQVEEWRRRQAVGMSTAAFAFRWRRLVSITRGDKYAAACLLVAGVTA